MTSCPTHRDLDLLAGLQQAGVGELGVEGDELQRRGAVHEAAEGLGPSQGMLHQLLGARTTPPNNNPFCERTLAVVVPNLTAMLASESPLTTT